MRRANTLAILTLMFACGGLVIAALATVRGDPIASARLWSAGKLLLMLAAAGGWLGLMGLRRDCRNLTQFIEGTRTRPAAPEFLDSDPVMIALGAAVTKLVASAPARPAEESATDGDLAAKVRDLELRLKLAVAERQELEAALFELSDEAALAAPSSEPLDFDLSRAEQGRAQIDALLRDPKLARAIREVRQAAGGAGAGGLQKAVEHRMATPDGPRTYRVTLAPLGEPEPAPASAGSQPAVVAVVRDVTREKEVAEMKNDFVSLVSHELRTPLASIKAYVEMLIDGEAVDEKTTHEFYEIIQNEANRLGRLIDNILNVSRIESGLMKPDRRPVSLGEVVREAVSAIAPQAEQKGVRLVQEIAAGPDRTSADRDMIHQAVVNLLNNAIKYTPEGGVITVQTAVDPASGRLTARVADTGVGIAEADLPFVFDKFFRGDAAHRVACGTGLGLALVKHIVEALHGGRVFAQSELGKGSTFGFELEREQDRSQGSGVRSQESGVRSQRSEV